ncbi:MAG: hypothetical protein KBS59_00490 [Clostridiales bacterium]|nr:hypothetical protein [Clostridiales bacterium]
MQYGKTVIDGYIMDIGIGGYPEKFIISEDEYNSILAALSTKPEDEDGYVWMLRDGELLWDKVAAISQSEEVDANE